jgi:hypothetical protein
MPYYLRVLSTSDDCVPLATLRSVAKGHRLVEVLSQKPLKPGFWTGLVLTHEDGAEIAVIERAPVEPGSIASEELREFADEVSSCLPASAAEWLARYFPRVRCIYSQQILNDVERDDGWRSVRAIQEEIWKFAPSILQADNEGFSNEDGYHILWQFRESVDGTWWMGVLQDGDWQHFQMDLGNHQHRAAFFQGMIPDGVQPR